MVMITTSLMKRWAHAYPAHIQIWGISGDADGQVCRSESDCQLLRSHSGRSVDVEVHVVQRLIPLVNLLAFVFENVSGGRSKAITHAANASLGL